MVIYILDKNKFTKYIFINLVVNFNNSRALPNFKNIKFVKGYFYPYENSHSYFICKTLKILQIKLFQY